VVAVLTDSPNPRKYWSVLKTRLKAEGSQLATNCSQLKMQSVDGKFYLTDVADFDLPSFVTMGKLLVDCINKSRKSFLYFHPHSKYNLFLFA
jgi:hypothetical protein